MVRGVLKWRIRMEQRLYESCRVDWRVRGGWECPFGSTSRGVWVDGLSWTIRELLRADLEEDYADAGQNSRPTSNHALSHFPFDLRLHSIILRRGELYVG